MNPLEMLERAHARNAQLIAAIKPEQMAQPTPCEGWDIRHLMNHMVGGAHMFGAAAGRTEPSGPPPEDLLGDDPVAAYRAAADANLAGWRSEGAMEGTLKLPFGEMPASVASGINLLEAIIHGWDLAKASGQPFEADAATVEQVAAFSRQLVTDEVRQGGAFGAEVTVPEGAPAVDRLAGFLGRKP
ncbi:MAG: TIGR03086 family protein [Caldilineae bacterium]|nr:TIGR03086 family protein [Chloroflexota bacterium]MCB9175609.1 TIGR03086 family protein [Caldilineae bacterium]